MNSTAAGDKSARIEVLHGRDLIAAGEVRVIPVSPRVAIGGTAGLHPERKHDGNEDVIAYISSGDAEAVAVADGHFGKRAAELAIEVAVAELSRSRLRFGDPLGALSLVMGQSLRRIAEVLAPEFKRIENSPETSLLVLLRQGEQAFVANIGDSLALRRGSRGALELLNPLQRNWLGIGCALATECPDGHGVRAAAANLGIGFWQRGKAEKAFAMRQSLEQHYSASLAIEPGMSLLIGTDGLLEGREDAEEKIGYSLLRAEGQTAEQVAHEILAGAMARGCPDNVAFVLLLPEDHQPEAAG